MTGSAYIRSLIPFAAVLACGCLAHHSPSAANAPVAVHAAIQPASPTPEETESAASARSTARGKPSIDFALPDPYGSTVRLGNLRGKWVVLYFYPADDTPGCTCEATEFTQLLTDLRMPNAAVIGISADSPESHARFALKYGLALTLLSDMDRTVMRKYGAWIDIPEGLGAPGRVIRSTYLIDPSGNIAWHWPEVIPQGHAFRVATRLAQLQKQLPS